MFDIHLFDTSFTSVRKTKHQFRHRGNVLIFRYKVGQSIQPALMEQEDTILNLEIKYEV